MFTNKDSELRQWCIKMCLEHTRANTTQEMLDRADKIYQYIKGPNTISVTSWTESEKPYTEIGISEDNP